MSLFRTDPVRRLLSSLPSRQLGYPHTHRIETRWHDNDSFGHINNVVYYSFMDTAVNTHLLENGLDERRFVAASSCQYLQPMAYPQPVSVGLSISKLGRSSVTYSIGIFSEQPSEQTLLLCANGLFTHVYVDADGRPSPVAEHVRTALQLLVEREKRL